MDILAENETLIKKLHPSRWYFWQLYFVGFLLLVFGALLPAFGPALKEAVAIDRAPEILALSDVFLFLFGLGSILVVELLRIINIYYISDKRLIKEFIFLSRRVTSCYHSQVQNINSVQGIIERIAGIGNLEFHTAGWGQSNKPEICFFGVKDPMILKNIITEAKLKEEQK